MRLLPTWANLRPAMRRQLSHEIHTPDDILMHSSQDKWMSSDSHRIDKEIDIHSLSTSKIHNSGRPGIDLRTNSELDAEKVVREAMKLSELTGIGSSLLSNGHSEAPRTRTERRDKTTGEQEPGVEERKEGGDVELENSSFSPSLPFPSTEPYTSGSTLDDIRFSIFLWQGIRRKQNDFNSYGSSSMSSSGSPLQFRKTIRSRLQVDTYTYIDISNYLKMYS